MPAIPTTEFALPGVVSHIPKFGDASKSPQEMWSFPTGDVSSPLEMRIPRTHIYISRERCGRISNLWDM